MERSRLRFKDLPIGQLFLWRDQLYIKTSPLAAVAQAGGAHRLVPRSAEIRLADENRCLDHTEDNTSHCSPEAVRDAIEAFYEVAQQLLSQHNDSDRTQQALKAARDRALDGLHLRAAGTTVLR